MNWGSELRKLGQLEVSRGRQNDAVEYARSIGLSVIADAFPPKDAFGNGYDETYNPDEMETSFGRGFLPLRELSDHPRLLRGRRCLALRGRAYPAVPEAT